MNRHYYFRLNGIRWMKALTWCMLAGAGCGMRVRLPVTNRAFLLQIDPVPDRPRVSLAIPLRIRTCRVAAPFASSSLVYRLTAVQYQYDTYNTFLVPLGDQLDDALHRWLGVSAGATVPSDRLLYTLEPYLEGLVADFTEPNRPFALARMRFVLTRSGPGKGRSSVVFERNPIATVRLPAKPTAGQVVAAFSGCIQEILTPLRDELAALHEKEGEKDDPGSGPIANR